MLRSTGMRFAIVGVLALIMFIPLFFAAEVINARKHYSQSTIDTVGQEWGGRQSLSGPVMVIPVERPYTQVKTRPKIDPATGLAMIDATTGKELVERYEETGISRVKPIYLYPDQFTATINSETEIRSRGIFRAPVYTAQAEMQFDFDTASVSRVVQDNENVLWDLAEIHIHVSANRALRGVAEMTADGRVLSSEPLTESAGFVVAAQDPRETTSYQLKMGFNGAQEIFVSPVGRSSDITLTSDWPHPSFSGGFLPNTRDITDEGFTANWSIPHLARTLPQVNRDDSYHRARSHEITFGVRLIEPNDFYQKAFRAARYGILFIALTFLTILLTETSNAKPTHPVQYILVGLAQTIFVLLMVAYAEHLGFELSYLISSGATIALLTLFGIIGLKMGTRVWVLSAALIVVYTVLYLILKSADYALLAGSTLAFLALAVTMIATRNEDWYGPEKPKKVKPPKDKAPETTAQRKLPWPEPAKPDEEA